MRTIAWILFVGATLAAAGCAQKPSAGAPQPASDTGQAASNALATLRKLVTEQNFKSMGFNSLDEVKSAQLSDPLPMSNFGLDRLKNYQAGQDANTLLSPSTETIYPVTLGGEVRSSVTLVKKDSGYAVASFGNAEVVKSLTRYRNANTPGAFVVRIPTLGIYMLGSRVGNRLMLTPIVEDTRLPFRPGVAVPADDVLKALAPLAQAYNGLPM
jgi:hypothetical protein